MLRDVLRDLKYALRSFGRRPLFTGVILLTLALGIGSNVAIFSVANAVLFRPLPFQNPDELAFVWTRLPNTNVSRSLVSGPDLKDFQTETTNFQGFAAAAALPGTLTGDGPPERITNAYVTWNLLDLIGVHPILGRTHRAEDAFPIDPKQFGNPNPNLPPNKVVLSWGLWQRRFGGDSSVIGRTILMDGWGSVVIGVLPRDFRIYLPADAAMPTNIDAWGILPSNLSDFQREAAFLTVVTRLKPGVTLPQAQDEMNRLAARLRENYQVHKSQNLQIVVAGMHRDVVEHARPALLALLGAVGFVLLIACANIANLLLVRASERHREIAVRAALGSGRARIVAQMLTESLVLAAGGMVLGLLLAWQGIGIIKALSPANLPRIESVSLDPRSFVFAAAVSVLAAVLFGLAPALRAVRGNLAEGLRDRGTDTGGARGNKLRTVLVVSEVTLSLVLLIGAGLMVRSFAAIQKVDPGFDPGNVVTFNAPVPFIKYLTSQARATFVNQVGDRLAAISGVESVGGVTPLPLAGGEQYSVGSYGKMGEAEDVYRANKADFKAVLPGYFEAMRIQLLSGRTFARSDNEEQALDVAIIDAKLAAKMFGNTSPLGAQILVDHFDEKTFQMGRGPGHHRGRGRECAVGIPHRRGARDDLCPVCVPGVSADHLRGAHHRRPHQPDQQDPDRGQLDRPRRPGRRPVHPRVVGDGGDGADPVPARALRDLRRPGAGARRDRPLRGDFLLGAATDPGDRGAGRARSQRWRRSPPDPGPGPGAGGDRDRAGARRFGCPDPGGDQLSGRSKRHRSGHLCRGATHAGGSRGPGVVPPGAPRDQYRSGSRAPGRVRVTRLSHPRAMLAA